MVTITDLGPRIASLPPNGMVDKRGPREDAVDLGLNRPWDGGFGWHRGSLGVETSTA
jgi:hypothetical protein